MDTDFVNPKSRKDFKNPPADQYRKQCYFVFCFLFFYFFIFYFGFLAEVSDVLRHVLRHIYEFHGASSRLRLSEGGDDENGNDYDDCLGAVPYESDKGNEEGENDGSGEVEEDWLKVSAYFYVYNSYV